MPMMHGTTGAVAEVIRSAGLVEPWPGRGVSATPDRSYAERVAAAACLRERDRRDGHEREVVGLVVLVDLDGLECWPTGTLDPWSPDSLVTAQVPPERVLEVETLAVELPPRGSWLERLELSTGGCAVLARRWPAEPTLERARQLAQTARP